MEAKTMGTQRLEAFTDGVIAIVITIMVLEIKVPHGATPEALLAILPILLTYVLSFINVGLSGITITTCCMPPRGSTESSVGELVPALLPVSRAICHSLDR